MLAINYLVKSGYYNIGGTTSAFFRASNVNESELIIAECYESPNLISIFRDLVVFYHFEIRIIRSYTFVRYPTPEERDLLPEEVALSCIHLEVEFSARLKYLSSVSLMLFLRNSMNR